MEPDAVQARLISDWLETRRTDWVRINAHWKQMADARLGRELQTQLGMSGEAATVYVQDMVKSYRSKGWIR